MHESVHAAAPFVLRWVALIPLIPLLVSVVILLGFKEDPRSKGPYLGIAAMFWCFIQSVAIFAGIADGSSPLPYEGAMSWLTLAADAAGKAFAWDMKIGVLIDGPAAVMLVVVTFVSLLVQIYSLAYMHGDARFKRYYAYLSFFTAAMLGLVVSNNLLITFACWELVGVSSYLLIGFWFEKKGPPYASKKAFMTTKLGDCGFYLALLLIFAKIGTFQLTQMQEFVARGYLGPTAALLIGVGLLFGAMGKSAQWPLFIWLPDAMEGPTPVSALIHAATMVAAGIYLVAKCYFFYAASPLAMEIVAWIGLITAFTAATMALVTYDIKRVLAFSTVSQLGFMMCALGLGGYTAGLFHLTTHAFFKALLFLGAGSVIHAVHSNDMREMGGLSKKLPITFATMAVGTVAIAGIWPLSGYFSKHAIFEVALAKSVPIFWVLAVSAAMTAFYMVRMISLTFLGADRDHEKHHHAHESPRLMWVPLALLALLSVVSGGLLHWNHFFDHLVSYALPAAEGAHGGPHWMMTASTAAIFGAIGLSLRFYAGRDFKLVESVKAALLPAFNLLDRRYYFDELFLALVAFSDKVAALCYRVDSEILDRIFVDGWALVTRIWAELSQLFDNLFVDRTVDGFGGLTWDVGVGLRSLVRNGQVQEYLMYVAITVSIFTTLILNR